MPRVQVHILDDHLGEQPVGTAFILDTGVDRLPYVVHAPTLRTPGSIAGTDEVYTAMWAAPMAIYQHNAADRRSATVRPISTAAMPAMGTGFGDVPSDEAARQMAAAYRHYHSPPHRLGGDPAIGRQLAIAHDGPRQVVRG